MFSLSKTYSEAHSLSSDFAVAVAWSRTVDLTALLPVCLSRSRKPSFSSSLSVVMRIMLRALKSSVNIVHVQQKAICGWGGSFGEQEKDQWWTQRQKTDFCRGRSYTRTRRWMPSSISQRILYVNATVFALYLTFFDFLFFPSFCSMETIIVGLYISPSSADRSRLERRKKKKRY